MVLRSLFTGLFVLTSLYLLLSHQIGTILAAPGNANVNNNPDRVRQRARLLTRFVRPLPYSRLKNEPFISDFIVDDDDFFELTKKQQSDDYGHLRFGKREEMSDDYGHMRFGRSGQTDK